MAVCECILVGQTVMFFCVCHALHLIQVKHKHHSLIAAGGSGVTLYAGPDLKLFILVGYDRSSSFVAWSTKAQLMIFF